MIASYEYGRFTAGVKGDFVYRPRIFQARPPIIYCHSASMDGCEANGSGQLPDIRTIIRALVADGWSVAAPSLALNWGNTTSLTRINDALAWLRARGATNDPAILIGSSMGAAASLCWAAANSVDTAAVIGFIPAVDLEAIRQTNTSLRDSIDVAYGVTYPAALPPGADPATLDFSDIPIQLWTASDDAVSLNAASVATDHRDLGALDHTTAAVAAVDTNIVQAFIASNS